MLDKNETFFFLDVREPRELEEFGTLKGYVNIPVSQLEGRVGEIPKGSKVVTACQRGVRAGRAAAILEKAGYKVIGVCGMHDWRERGMPLIYPKAGTK
jgi:rhodanese-related sulfurtransferase